MKRVLCFFTSISHINQSQFLSWSWQRRPPKMDEENELKASFQKLSNFFFYLIGQRVYLSIKVGKKVSKGAFSVIQLIFADSRISLCHCHQTCLTTTTTIFDWPTFFGHDCTWRSWWWLPIWEMTSDGLWSKPWRVQWQSFREYSRWSVRHGRSGRLQRSPWRPWPSCPQSFSVLDDWS